TGQAWGRAFAKLIPFATVVALFNDERDRKSTRLNSSHLVISYAVFCLKKKNLFLCSLCLTSPASPLLPAQASSPAHSPSLRSSTASPPSSRLAFPFSALTLPPRPPPSS